MLTCQQVTQLVTDDADGTVSRPQQRLLHDHLASCPPCRRLSRHHHAVLALLARLSGRDRSPPTCRDAERVAHAIAARPAADAPTR